MRYIKVSIIALFVTICCFFSLLMINGYLQYKQITHKLPLESMIETITNNSGYVRLSEVSDDFIHALISVEDPNFYSHNGIVLTNIVEAFFTNLKEKEYAMGGSTITQQLAKNLYLDQKKTMQRKVTELIFAKELENKLSKEKILELYINVIYFGDGYYGIKNAAEGYFKTSPKQLTISQATLLAGLPQAPAIYQLSNGYSRAKKRQLEVLDAMIHENFINENEKRKIYLNSV